MKLFVFCFCVLSSLIPYLQADPSPDTIQIQNYDGPIFLHSPKFNCCPLCNSPLTCQTPAVETETPCTSEIPEECISCSPGASEVLNCNPCGTGPGYAYMPSTSRNQCETGLGNACSGTSPAGLFHTNAKATSGVTYSRPLSSASSYTAPSGITYSLPTPGNTFNTYTGPGTSGNPFCGTSTIQPTITATECTCITKPLSSYLPINTSQNTCSYKVPVVVGSNQVFGAEEEQVLVPQKFSYSLVLDGDVAPTYTQNGQYDCNRYSYYSHC